MSSVESWSSTAASNNLAPPNGFPEGQTPASLNNSARELMASLATFVRQLPWVKLTTGLTLVRNSSSQFQLTSVDVTADFAVGRRLREVGATTVYGSVASVSFTGGHTLVNVTNDAAANIPTSLTRVDVSCSDLLSIPPSSAQSTTPNTAGTLRWSAASTPEADELTCNGAAVSRSTYSVLFAKIGTTWGVGDGSTTFNVPDLRGRTLVNSGTGSGLTARTLGQQAIGAETHALTGAENGPHVHSGTVHSHDVIRELADSDATAGGGNGKLVGDGNESGSLVTITGAGATAIQPDGGGDTGSSGSGTGHNNMQPSAVGNVFIHI
jgi:microcystin-dependent protein